VKPSPEAVQQPLLPGVADRVTGWVCVQSDIASDGGPDRGELDDRGPSPAIHDPCDRPARHPARATHVLVAEPGGALRSGELGEHAQLVLGGNSDCAGNGSVSGGHWVIMRIAASLAVH
jgi:hypothetical protein